MKIIRKGQNRITKNPSDKLKKFKPILDEIIISGNDILAKTDRIILPIKLQSLAHKGSHTDVSELEGNYNTISFSTICSKRSFVTLTPL